MDGPEEDHADQPISDTTSAGNLPEIEVVRAGIVRTLRLAQSDSELDRIPGDESAVTEKGRAASSVDSFDSFNSSRSNFIFFDRPPVTDSLDPVSGNSPRLCIG